MKKIILLLALASCGKLAFAQNTKKGNKKNNKTEQTVPVKDANLESDDERHSKIAMMESRMTGPMHHFLMQWSGHWLDEMKIWANPKSEPTITMTTRDGRMTQEGRFLSTTIIGQIANIPYEANSVLGYDNAKMKFTKIWYDNLSTGILVLEGTYNQEKNLIDFVGFTNDPVTHQPIKVHQIMRIVDPNTQILEVYTEVKEGKEIKSMEIRSTR